MLKLQLILHFTTTLAQMLFNKTIVALLFIDLPYSNYTLYNLNVHVTSNNSKLARTRIHHSLNTKAKEQNQTQCGYCLCDKMVTSCELQILDNLQFTVAPPGQ